MPREQPPGSRELGAIRKSLRYGQVEFAALLGVPYGRYKNWEYSTPPPENILLAARSIASGEVTRVRTADSSKVAQALVYQGRVLLAAWRGRGGMMSDSEFSFSEMDGESDLVAVPSFFVTGDPALYRVVVVSGWSMSPRIDPGAQLVVKLADEAAPRVLTVVQSPAGQLFVKTFARDDYGNPELRSVNPSHPPIPATQLEGWRVRAVVVGIIHARTGEPGPNLEYYDGAPIVA